MVKLKGTTLYPPAIFEILQQIDAVRDFVVEVFKGELETDELKLHILPSDGNQSQVDQQLRAAFQSRIRVVPEIKFVSAKEIEVLQHGAGSRKVKKFIDNR
jgi:phenylacetate-CoA ligase